MFTDFIQYPFLCGENETVRHIDYFFCRFEIGHETHRQIRADKILNKRINKTVHEKGKLYIDVVNRIFFNNVQADIPGAEINYFVRSDKENRQYEKINETGNEINYREIIQA